MAGLVVCDKNYGNKQRLNAQKRLAVLIFGCFWFPESVKEEDKSKISLAIDFISLVVAIIALPIIFVITE